MGLRPLRTAQSILKTYPTYALVNACPTHLIPQDVEMTEHFTSYKILTNQ
jgi:hypothetical protein